MKNESDERLYFQILEGQEKAFEELYARYEAPLFTFIYRLLGEKAVAEEIFQECLLKVLRGRELDFSKGSFRGWLYQVARNLCLDHLRKQSRRSKVQEASVETDMASEFEHQQSRGFQWASLWKGVGNLPRPLGQLFRFKLSGFSNEEISQAMNIPVGTVKSRTHKMIALLKEEIKENE